MFKNLEIYFFCITLSLHITEISLSIVNEDSTNLFGALESDSIIEGTDALDGEFPWQVSLQTNDGEHFCGGSIVSEEWLVTAAHCIHDVDDECGYFCQVRVGSLHYESGGSVHKIKKYIIYHAYNFTSFDNDIALIKVEPPFEFDASIQPVKQLAPAPMKIPAGTMVDVSGWGNVEASNNTTSHSPNLQKVRLPIVSIKECQQKLSEVDIQISPDHQICAGFEAGIPDACQGDSGGGMTIHGELYGIVSYGYLCSEPNKPGVYTEVAAFVDWIRLMTDEGTSSRHEDCTCDFTPTFHIYFYIIITIFCIIHLVSLSFKIYRSKLFRRTIVFNNSHLHVESSV